MKPRKSQIIVKCTPGEKKLLKERSVRSGYSTVSPYAREVLLLRPVKVYLRDASLDVFIGEAIQLRKALQSMREQWERAGYPAEPVLAVLGTIDQNISKIYALCMSKYNTTQVSEMSCNTIR